MSTTTTKHGLIKPELTDPADITQFNENWDKIDEKLNAIPITSEIPSDAEMWIDPDEETVEESHINNKNNPHGVTAAQVGAAPAGYGLGEVLKEVEHADSCMLTGIYRVKSGHPFDYGRATIFVTGDSNSILTQIAFGINLSPTSRNAIAVRNYSSAFEAWEWINPPMKTDVEYRTTERYKGNPVYTMLVDFGTLPSNNYRDEEFTDVSVTAINIECIGNYIGERTYADLTSVDFVDSVQVMNNKIRITTTLDGASKWNAMVRVWYTKV